MTGGRLLVRGGPDRDARLLAAKLAAPGRRTAAFSLQTALQLAHDALPDVAVLSAFDATPGQLLELLAWWRDLPVHAVFLAAADAPVPAWPGLRNLSGLDATSIAAVCDILAAGDAASRAARQAEAWRTAFIAAFPGFIVACNRAYQVAFANAPVISRSGRDPVGAPCHTALHGRDAPCPWCPWELAESGQSVAMEIQSPLDGRFYSMTSTALRLPEREPLLLTLYYDITDRNMALSRLKSLNRNLERRVGERTDTLARQAEDLAEANARLRELDNLKSGFLATVTHDLRTPLTSVLGFAKLTRRDFLKDFMPFSEVSDKLRRKGTRIAENLGIIEAEGARLTRLVNDFLDLSKIESGRLDWNDRVIDPSEVARAAIDAVSGEYEQNQAMALVVDMPQRLPPLRLDPDRLMQVLVNLLTNAVRHTGEGEVTLSARPLPGKLLELRVADTGPGIPAAERERIFEKYHQARRGDTTSSVRRGTGLGLAICKHIVERYGGTIRAEDRTPHGTAFVVELPVWTGGGDPSAPPEITRPEPDLPVS
ncbi:HAMP domain-containing sensor histidine kinase [Solidesulfovibrio sp.]|jgi:signal transduction histidine kinase|uniref:sensor histidine kinase n=1 Tax=Solidesulfovibrio sp. TaxID=2910990 RepID=UPI002B2132E0|nr:HAMP domain-containing sensor histidine kinase [Solidesulfovibrio sp.]MEA5090707.1 HAMP domain-containing sensor histidine kinase [Solidesulfovibrio sp.]HML62735.1 HAMP domain-containing sensor histidine kinase [Solidesulfovibrio sp.]